MGMKYLVFMFLLSATSVWAQKWKLLPQLENPNLPNSYCQPLSNSEVLYSENLIKTTAHFDFFGPVKTAKEYIYFSTYEGQEVFKRSFIFQGDGKLVQYLEDTLPYYQQAPTRIEKCTYDPSKATLLKREVWGQNAPAKEIQIFDSLGYMIHKDYTEIKAKPWIWNDQSRSSMDFKVDFLWTIKRDSVYQKYTYKTDTSPYSRYPNRWYRIPHKEENTQDNLNSFSGFYREFDSLGRIILFEILDLTIKNSYNVNQKFEYYYNEKGLLSDVIFSTNGPHPHYTPSANYHIDYLDFDSQGNWTKRLVTNNLPGHYSQGANKFYYERSIVYF